MNRNELVEKMAAAFSHTKGNDMEKCISAALDVASDELLKEEPEGEFIPPYWASIRRFLASRRAALAHVKTPEERVTIQYYLQNPARWMVLLDGANPASVYFRSPKDAERYRRGLIEELKESQ